MSYKEPKLKDMIRNRQRMDSSSSDEEDHIIGSVSRGGFVPKYVSS